MPSIPTTNTLYVPRRDWWVVVVGLLFALTFIAMIPTAFFLQVEIWQQVLLSGVGVIVAISTIDKLFFTVYELSQQGLSVHSQLRHLHVPYRQMRGIDKGGVLSLFTTRKRKRFAFSRKSLRIQVSDMMWDEITVSPHERDAFLEQLLAIIDDERSRRATVTREVKKKRKA
jgi:hypothetical protein